MFLQRRKNTTTYNKSSVHLVSMPSNKKNRGKTIAASPLFSLIIYRDVNPFNAGLVFPVLGLLADITLVAVLG